MPDSGRAGRREAMMVVGAVGVMLTAWIDIRDEGLYHADTVLIHGSRKERAEKRAYTISSVGTGLWDVRRPGGATHRVSAWMWNGILRAGCDCYDFTAYGAARYRACQHIWAVWLT